MTKALPLRTCANPECKKSYPPKTSWQRFCGKVCHDGYHNGLFARFKKRWKAKESKP